MQPFQLDESRFNGATPQGGDRLDNFEPGDYEVEVTALKPIVTMKIGKVVVVECTVTASDNPKHKVGAPAKQMICLDKGFSGYNDLRTFVSTAAAIPFTDATLELANLVLSPQQVLAGSKMGLRARKNTKGTFTNHYWRLITPSDAVKAIHEPETEAPPA